MTDVSEQAVCYRHPDRATGLSCSHCGRPICAACTIPAAVGQRCPECVRAQGAQQVINVRQSSARPSFRAIPVTYTIIGVALAIAALSLLSLNTWGTIASELAMWPEGVSRGEWWRMLTVVFVHVPLTDGLLGIMHVGFNMYITYRLGAQVERQMGSVAYGALYFASAAAGSMFAYFIGPNVAGVGASGAAFGLFGVWLAPAVRRRGTTWGRRIMNELGGVLLLNAAVPFIIDGVAWEAHLGGLLAGFGVGWVWTMQPITDNRVARAGVAGLVLLLSVLSTQL